MLTYAYTPTIMPCNTMSCNPSKTASPLLSSVGLDVKYPVPYLLPTSYASIIMQNFHFHINCNQKRASSLDYDTKKHSVTIFNESSDIQEIVHCLVIHDIDTSDSSSNSHNCRSQFALRITGLDKLPPDVDSSHTRVSSAKSG